MQIEVTKPYMRHASRENENARVITIYRDGNQVFDILVCLTYRQVINGDISSTTLSGGMEPLYRASMAVGTNFLGEMRLVKNRYGPDGINDEEDVRQTIIDSLWNMGFTHLEASRVMTEFNHCLTEITGEPILYMNTYPYGVSRRRYMMEEHKKALVKKYNITRHRLI